MTRLDNNEVRMSRLYQHCLNCPPQFLEKLQGLFEEKRSKGTVFLTTKRCKCRFSLEATNLIAPLDSFEHPENDADETYPCLIRATDGKTTKFSTLVSLCVSRGRKMVSIHPSKR